MNAASAESPAAASCRRRSASTTKSADGDQRARLIARPPASAAGERCARAARAALRGLAASPRRRGLRPVRPRVSTCRRRCRGAWSAACFFVWAMASRLVIEALFDRRAGCGSRTSPGPAVEGRGRGEAHELGLGDGRVALHGGQQRASGSARWSSTLHETWATPPRAASVRPIARRPGRPSRPTRAPPRRSRGASGRPAGARELEVEGHQRRAGRHERGAGGRVQRARPEVRRRRALRQAVAAAGAQLRPRAAARRGRRRGTPAARARPRGGRRGRAPRRTRRPRSPRRDARPARRPARRRADAGRAFPQVDARDRLPRARHERGRRAAGRAGRA